MAGCDRDPEKPYLEPRSRALHRVCARGGEIDCRQSWDPNKSIDIQCRLRVIKRLATHVVGAAGVPSIADAARAPNRPESGGCFPSHADAKMLGMLHPAMCGLHWSVLEPSHLILKDEV